MQVSLQIQDLIPYRAYRQPIRCPRCSSRWICNDCDYLPAEFIPDQAVCGIGHALEWSCEAWLIGKEHHPHGEKMNAHVKWQKGLTFTGTADTGYTVPLGARPEEGGANDGFRPMELLATGLAGCTAMDVISILIKKQQDVTNFEVAVHTKKAKQHPRVFIHITIDYQVTGHKIDEKAVVRAIELSAKRYCPAQSMLSQVVPIDLQYEIYEGDGNQRSEIIASGEFKSGEFG